jgi:hypothetical protein
MPINPESKLQIACVKLFDLLYPNSHGRLFMNHNNPNSARQGVLLVKMGMVAGVADMTLLGDRGIIFIELKTPKGKQSETQKQWQQICETAGYQYRIIRSVKQFYELLTTNLRPVNTTGSINGARTCEQSAQKPNRLPRKTSKRAGP